MDEAAERLGRLCAQAGGEALSERATRYGAGAALDRLKDAVRSGARGSETVTDLQALDDAFARNGIDGLTTGPRAYQPLHGRPHPVVAVWACPAVRPCSRMEPQSRGNGREAEEAPPLCALAGQPLVSQRIRL